MSYSTRGANGTFIPVPLTGSTIKEGAIQGYVGPLQGVTLAPHSAGIYTFEVTLGKSVPISGKRPLMAFETYLDQIDPADETAATLGDTYAYQVVVSSDISPSSPSTTLIAIAAGIILAIGGFVIWRTATRPPHEPPLQPAPG